MIEGTGVQAKEFVMKAIASGKGAMAEFTLLSGGTVLSEFSRFVVATIVARWLGPEKFGVWNALNVLITYGVLVGLGVPSAMQREVPILMGRDDRGTAYRVIDLSFWIVVLGASGVGVIVSGLAALNIVGSPYRSAMLAMGPLFIAWQILQFYQMASRSLIKFHLLSAQLIAGALLMPCIVLALSHEYGLPGFIVGHAVVTAVCCLFIHYGLGIRFRWPTIWYRTSELMKIGLPLVTAGVVDALMCTVDRFVILGYLGVEPLGYYTPVIYTLFALRLVPTVIAQQFYPRMALKYGETGKKRSLLLYLGRQSMATAAAGLPLVAVVYFALPHFIGAVLPKYAPGLEPARIIALGCVIPILISSGPALFLNVINRQTYSLGMLCIGLAINVTLSVTFVKAGWELYGVALASAISYSLVPLGWTLIAGVLMLKND